MTFAALPGRVYLVYKALIGWRNTCCVGITPARCYTLLFCETHDLVCEIISVSEEDYEKLSVL